MSSTRRTRRGEASPPQGSPSAPASPPPVLSPVLSDPGEHFTMGSSPASHGGGGSGHGSGTATPDSSKEVEALSNAVTRKMSIIGGSSDHDEEDGRAGGGGGGSSSPGQKQSQPRLPVPGSHKRELSSASVGGGGLSTVSEEGGGMATATISAAAGGEDPGYFARMNSVEMLEREGAGGLGAPRLRLVAGQPSQPPPGKRSNGGATPAGIRALKGLSEASPSMYEFGGASFPAPAVTRGASGPLPSKGRTLVIYPPLCLRHETMNHQEHKDRLTVLCGPQGVLRRPRFADLEWADGESVAPACIADILRVHDYDYVKHLQRLCRALPDDAAASLLETLPPRFQGTGPPPPPPPELMAIKADEMGGASSSSGGGSGSEDMMMVQGADPATAYRNSGTAAGGTASRVMPNLSHNTSIRDFPIEGLGPSFGGEISPSSSLDASDDEEEEMEDASAATADQATAVRGMAAMNATATMGEGSQAVSQFLDTDTRVSRDSFAAARVAAGAVIQAVDFVASGLYRRVFVATRPPGHHAGPRGAVPSHCFYKAPGMCSSGFCLLNNVAIGAAYARHTYGRAPHGPFQRVAIIDWDIHHGNGTEECVRALRPCKRALPLPASWAPVAYDLYKPWLTEDDAAHVFFGSINLVDGVHFYPCSGRAVDNDFARHPHIVNVELTPVRASNTAAAAAVTKPRANVHVSDKKLKENCKKASDEFRAKVGAELLPRLRAFGPDIIFISAGFDGHQLDLYHWLTDDDYAWLTSELVAVAEAKGAPIISVLEGGYAIRPPEGASGGGGGKAGKPSTRTAAARAAAAAAAAKARGQPAGIPASSSSSSSVGGGGADGSSSVHSAGGGSAATTVASSDDEGFVSGGRGAREGGHVNLETDGGLARGVMAHVLALMEEASPAGGKA